MVELNKILNRDTEKRIKLEEGIALRITKFTLTPSKKGNWITSRIDSVDITGKTTYYYATGSAISGTLETLQDEGIIPSEDDPIICTVVTRVSEEGRKYLTLE